MGGYLDDKDLPQPGDMDDDSVELRDDMVCPSCGARVTEDTQKCPHCGDWITPRDPGRSGVKRWIFVVAVLLMLYAMLRFIF